MKKAVYFLFAVLFITVVYARVQWTPAGFVVDGRLIAVTGRQTAELRFIPSTELTQEECRMVSEQIMFLYRERRASSVKIHPRYIEECSRAGYTLPGVMTILPFTELVEEARRRAEEEAR